MMCTTEVDAAEDAIYFLSPRSSARCALRPTGVTSRRPGFARRGGVLIAVCLVIVMATLSLWSSEGDEAAPNQSPPVVLVADQVRAWQKEEVSLSMWSMRAVQVLKGLDAALDRFFADPHTLPTDQERLAFCAIDSAEEVAVVMDWAQALLAALDENPDVPVSEPQRNGIRRLYMQLQLMSAMFRADQEPNMTVVMHVLANDVFLPVIPFPDEGSIMQRIRRLAGAYPDAVQMDWPRLGIEEQRPWTLQLGHRTTRELLPRIGRKRLREVLQSLPDDAIEWSVDFRGLISGLLENRLMLRVDVARSRVVLEEIAFNLRRRVPQGQDHPPSETP